ncbi:hypothetical protein BC936DRAFT_138044 [Jimgerdemannia flammicorona]|uniref:Uncharacterized protein n=1 Tax=Jimgerdemannia flammicorona TaxID=994334 RepID=A0A433DIS7_9FUNG|nr:hypothetical protein BC936DRAFT_138044 [Jimgerdemannia flammicorona]
MHVHSGHWLRKSHVMRDFPKILLRPFCPFRPFCLSILLPPPFSFCLLSLTQRGKRNKIDGGQSIILVHVKAGISDKFTNIQVTIN